MKGYMAELKRKVDSIMRKSTQIISYVILIILLMTSFWGCDTGTQTIQGQHQPTIASTNTTSKIVKEELPQNYTNIPTTTETVPAQTQKQENTTVQPTEATNVSGTLKVHFLDVGQADSILINAGSAVMLVDAGNNADADNVVNYIKAQGIKKLDYIIATHPHEDHIGGMDAVVNAFDIGKVIMPKVQSNTKTFEDLLRAIAGKGLKITSPVPGTKYSLGEAEFTILAPNGSDYEDVNDYSVVVKLQFGKTSFLLTGDAGVQSEGEMLLKGFDLKADLLKVGHHGSHYSTSDEFLKAVSPKFAVISV